MAQEDGCPENEPQSRVFVRTLYRACERAGGIAPLARQLGVSPIVLIRWLDGAAPVPRSAFLRCLDYLFEAPTFGRECCKGGAPSPEAVSRLET